MHVDNKTNEFYAAATFYFGNDDFVAYKRYETHGRVGFLSNVGGLLGLFMGISLLSIVETIYFFTLRFINDLYEIVSI